MPRCRRRERGGQRRLLCVPGLAGMPWRAALPCRVVRPRKRLRVVRRQDRSGGHPCHMNCTVYDQQRRRRAGGARSLQSRASRITSRRPAQIRQPARAACSRFGSLLWRRKLAILAFGAARRGLRPARESGPTRLSTRPRRCSRFRSLNENFLNMQEVTATTSGAGSQTRQRPADAGAECSAAARSSRLPAAAPSAAAGRLRR